MQRVHIEVCGTDIFVFVLRNPLGSIQYILIFMKIWMPSRGTPWSNLITQIMEMMSSPCSHGAKHRNGELSFFLPEFWLVLEAIGSISSLSFSPSILLPSVGTKDSNPPRSGFGVLLLGYFALTQLHKHACWHQRSDSKIQERQDTSCLVFINKSAA